MSDLAATNCGCDEGRGNNWIWIIILLCCCGGNDGFGGGCGCGGNGGFGGDSCLWIIILLCCCGGGGNGFW